MNPSYENGGQSNAGSVSNVPGVKPGVIASGPDPEDVPPKPIATPSGLSIGSSRQPTGGRPMNMPMSMPVSAPAGNDVVTSVNGESGSNRKGLIIGGVIAGVVALVLVVVLAVVMGNGGSGGGSSTATASGSFNRLINYITSGQESEAEITESYDDTYNYYFSSDFEDEADEIMAYDKTKNLVDSFANAYQDGDNQILNNLVKTVKQMYDFMYVVNLKNPISESDAIKNIIENGESSATEELISYYDFSGLTDNTYVEAFNSSYAEWVNALSEEVTFFRNNDCISGSYMVLSCIANKNDASVTAKWDELKKKVEDAYAAWGAYLGNEGDFVANVYATNDIMRGKSTIIVEGGEDESE